MITNCKPVVKITEKPRIVCQNTQVFFQTGLSRDNICARSIVLCDFLTFSFILSSTPNLTKRQFSLKLPNKHFYVLYCTKAMEFFPKKKKKKKHSGTGNILDLHSRIISSEPWLDYLLKLKGSVPLSDYLFQTLPKIFYFNPSTVHK